jgi:acylphosphatase
MVKKRKLIKGREVHGVGYRLFLMDLAEEFGIEKFYAKNAMKNGVEVVEVFN